MKKVLSGKGEQLIYVGWNGPDDPANPRNWSPKRKWFLSVIGFLFCTLVSMSVSAYSVVVTSIQEELGTSRLLAISGLSLFTLTFGAAPLVLAPLSEVWGRREIYIISAFVFGIFQIPQAVATNIQTILIVRFISGIGGSTAIALVGGTLSDLFANDERGMPMTIFSFAAFAPTGLGPLIFGYVAEFRGFRLVMWINFALAAAFTVVLAVVAKETRESVLLSRKAKKLRQETGDNRFVAQADEERASLATILKVSLTRPFRLFLTEPTIQAFTASISFAWAVLYILLISVPVVFQNVYHFSIGETGLVYTTLIVGTVAATVIGYYTNQLYLKHVGEMGPEARMYTGCLGGVMLPLGCWIWAWTTFASIHWIVPTIGLGILFAGMFLLYLTVFNYLADSYTVYAASALSAMNFWRNITGAAFPLFTDRLYDTLGIHGAGSLVAGIATLLAVIPFIAFRYGHKLRRNSKFAKEMAALQISFN
ncbi:MFS general substrate transporter [Cystobasidium minutum MCA 4210]|uniref:MFS general substrate transporter n=1 Tax=Cystobasidium minutum MCA 4210 TaxID=1397322 RepID=UPI0034CD494B|eukprot:jgi/Rhomi1/146786/e_gw1.7.194.1